MPSSSLRHGSSPLYPAKGYLSSTSGADIDQSPPPQVPLQTVPPTPNRGKVNEIDFCIAPADVSLSRAYSDNSDTSTQTLSLTRALNNASNRAVRRILLARSWPSAEALNLSLRQTLAAEQKQKQKEPSPDIPLEEDSESLESSGTGVDPTSGAKCPVPRPILNILMRRRNSRNEAGGISKAPFPRGRTDEEYVADQVQAFRSRYEELPGYPFAEAYLECVLSLATSGVESTRVKEVKEQGIYDESYRRVVSVLESVGVVFEPAPGSVDQRRIAKKLVDQDICLSMLDKMSMKREQALPSTIAEEDTANGEEEQADDVEVSPTNSENSVEKEDSKFRLIFWNRKEATTNDGDSDEALKDDEPEEEIALRPEDLGGVLLSAEEPTMTRQLNVLTNIVRRALLFGGDQELLVLSETLDADTPAFVNRWYPSDDGNVVIMDSSEENRPGVQYLNCLVQLLKSCYRDGVVNSLDPLLPLTASYSNAYERLTASLVELGSGYIKPRANVKSMPVPRTAQEELGRFAVWESSFRKSSSTPDVSSYPEDLEGSWEVKDEISGETIGVSTIVFNPKGEVDIAAPMQGLRWRLDPGPAHLDTCTFQVLSDDGTILQYRGFIDRGLRLEARFSKRPIRIRGSVMFQMRDGDTSLGDDYWKDMLPINYRTSTNKFVMTKKK